MAEIERIDVEDARRKTKAEGGALLVCAYEDEGKCNKIKLEGAISVAGLRELAAVPKDREIIFYCACPAEGSAADQAAKFQQQGFTNTKALKGGVEAWMQAGYPMAGA